MSECEFCGATEDEREWVESFEGTLGYMANWYVRICNECWTNPTPSEEEDSEHCDHDWRGVGCTRNQATPHYHGSMIVRDEPLLILEQCRDCGKYRKVSEDDVDIMDERGKGAQA